MNKFKKHAIIICSICIVIMVLTKYFLNSDTTIKLLKTRIKHNYPQVNTISMHNIGPNCTIRYYVKKNTSFEVCKDIFYDTVDIIYEEKMYKALNDTQKRYADNHDIVFLEIEFTTKEADRPAYGLICEFALENPPIISQEYEIENAVWRCVDANNNLLGEFKSSHRIKNK